ILLSALSFGAVFFFRSALQQALIEIDIEELSRYSMDQEQPAQGAHQYPSTPTKTPGTSSVEGQTSQPSSLVPTFSRVEIHAPQGEVHAPTPLTRTTISFSGTLT